MQNINRKSEDNLFSSSANLVEDGFVACGLQISYMFTVSHIWHFGSTSPPRIFSNVILLGFAFVVLFYQTCVTCPLICVFVQQVQVSSCFFFSTPRCPQRCHPRTPSLLHDILETVAVRMMESGKLYFQTAWYSCLINSLVSLNFFISDWFTA